MRRRLARWLRRVAARLDPPVQQRARLGETTTTAGDTASWQVTNTGKDT